MQATSRAEAERLLGIAEKLLEEKDLNAARDFALLAQETDPLLDASDRIMAIADVLISAGDDNQINHYAILQIEDVHHRNHDSDLIKQHYRRLALLLHPDHNKFPFAGTAFKLVGDAWDVLSDPAKKASYDRKLFEFLNLDLDETRNRKEREDEKLDLDEMRNRKEEEDRNSGEKMMPERRSSGEEGAAAALAENIWTPCPYCYNLFEYPRVFDGCCLRCANCERAFQAVAIPPESMPPLVPGREAYYCSPAFFPMSFPVAGKSTAVPIRMPPAVSERVTPLPSAENTVRPSEPRPMPEPEKKPASPANGGGAATRKRGRPAKNPLL